MLPRMARRALPTFDELYREIERLPEGITGEILDPGVLRTMSRPGSGHRHAGKGLTRTLGDVDAADGVPKLIASAAEVEVVTLPPFGLEMAIERFWLPRPEAPQK